MKMRNGQQITAMQALGYWFLDNWFRFLASFLLIVVCTLVYCIVNGWDQLIYYCNGLFIGGFSSILIGAIAVLSMFGAFDFASYYIFRKRNESGVEDYYEYSSRKRNEKMRNKLSFLPYVTLGAIALIASIVLNVLIYR